jgi:riboflavin synthase
LIHNTIFTGIIKELSRVKSIHKKDGSNFVIFKRPQKWTDLEEGESILINGVCSTALNIKEKSFEVEYMPETLIKTNLGNLQKDMIVNLERSLAVGERLGGHILSGHIDTVGTIGEVSQEKQKKTATKLKIHISEEWTRFIVQKGSIAINGISLTVVDVERDWFTVSLIRHTLEHTNLHTLRVDDTVNIEVDMMAKYLHKNLQDFYARGLLRNKRRLTQNE